LLTGGQRFYRDGLVDVDLIHLHEEGDHMKNLKIFFLSVSFVLICYNLSISGQDRISEIKRAVNKYTESKDLHGVILVAEKGKMLFAQSSGMANMAWGIPNDIETRFRIYSMSKQFTAMLVMQLVEQGKIELEKSISAYLPYYRKDVGEKVTIHHLLTHTHGIEEGYDRLPPFLVVDPTRQLIEKYFSNKIDFEPGEEFKYSGLLGYIILGAIIESVSGDSYRHVLQKNILDPLNMKNTYYLDYRNIIDKRASDYFRIKDGFEYRIQAYPVNADGASCIVSTVEDLLLWDQALYTNKLLTDDYMKIYLSPHVTDYAPQYYGYGWYISDTEVAGEIQRIYYHSGGGTSFILRSPSDNRTVIVLNNLISNKLYELCLEILTHMGNK
jgi:CubicO group peptidase (beta-lactamase class C family)